MTPEEFTARATAAVATVELADTSYVWLTRNVARRRTRRRLTLAAAAAATVAVAGVAVAVVPRDDSGVTTPAAPPGAIDGAIDGDVDGDGVVDEVTLVSNGTGRAWTWGVRVRGSSVEVVTVGFPPHIDPQGEQKVSGVVDVNRDGRAEVVVRAGTTGGLLRHYVLTLVGSRLEWVRSPGSDEPYWFVSNDVRNGPVNGWGCAGSEIYTVGANASGGVGQRSWYALSGATLVGTRSESLSWNPKSEAMPADYNGVHCGTVDP